MTTHPTPRKPVSRDAVRLPKLTAKQRAALRVPKMTAKQREEAIRLLREWREASPEEEREQREALEALKKGLNEGRKGYRLIFPES
jgi:hypothetical protein